MHLIITLVLQQINQAVAAFVPVRVVECELKLYTAACNVSVSRTIILFPVDRISARILVTRWCNRRKTFFTHRSLMLDHYPPIHLLFGFVTV